MDFFVYLLHHSEAIDPTLWDWIRHEIDAVVGLGPWTIVAVLSVVIVAFPLAVLVAARRGAPAPNAVVRERPESRLERRRRARESS